MAASSTRRRKKKSSRSKSTGARRSADDRITQYAIHPAIGIARVGNAPKEYFLAPEAPGVLPDPEGPVPGREDDWREGYKDRQGRIKRQACRFRVYGLDAKGKVVKEITADDATIEWSVHLAARKAAWYQFNNAMDLGEYAKESLMRNAGTDRKLLAITPPITTIEGRETNADGSTRRYRIAGKINRKYPAVLGELRSDEQGRLVVLGGPGDADSFTGFINPITTFANNEGWYDDIADGPVRAKITLHGSTQVHEAEPAFVATTPPNYGPGLLGVVTMYDEVLDLFHRESIGGQPPLPLPTRPSFTRDVYPILNRLAQTQWVNEGFFMLFGDGADAEMTTPERLERLSTLGATAKERRQNERARRAVFAWFRDPSSTKPQPALQPPFYGDAFGDFSGLPNDELAITRTQYAWLEQWAHGDFEEDWKGPPKAAPLHRIRVADQPAALDRAHLEDVLGGPFHPGIEITWTMRRASMWKAPFRLNVLPTGEQPRDDYGPILTPEACLGPDGPLNASGPGSLTRWMGTPWQTDSASCLSGYDASYYLPLPSFWAVRIPNQVLSRFSWDKATDPKVKPVQRERHYSLRANWLRDLQPDGNARRQDMVANWWKLGIVVATPAPRGRAKVGQANPVWVETGRDAQYTQSDPTRKMVDRAVRQVGPALDGKGDETSDVPAPPCDPPAGEDSRRVHIANRRRTYGRGDR